ncbi:MAG: serine/threonine-protein phosphatase [Anaerolineales bacterium]|nr:serine/threonine-protein phosphatase [Anaerolineales bacterium]
MEINIAVAKTKKYATSNSGDTVEIVERPNGGLSVVMADGQSSGRGAKWISTMVVRKVISLLAEGVRDGAAARAASDYLYTERRGRVSATLNILSIDQVTKTLVITRNNPAPVIVANNDQIRILDDKSLPVGNYRDTRPIINEETLECGLTALTYTDGITHAGDRSKAVLNVPQTLRDLLHAGSSAQTIADQILRRAVELDQGRPVDDITIIVMRVVEGIGDGIRRMTVSLPLKSY